MTNTTQSPELVRIACDLKRTTAQAVLIQHTATGVSTWIPRSTIVGDITMRADGMHVITMREWIARQKGLL